MRTKQHKGAARETQQVLARLARAVTLCQKELLAQAQAGQITLPTDCFDATALVATRVYMRLFAQEPILETEIILLMGRLATEAALPLHPDWPFTRTEMQDLFLLYSPKTIVARYDTAVEQLVHDRLLPQLYKTP